jgi:hypothetical protein
MCRNPIADNEAKKKSAGFSSQLVASIYLHQHKFLTFHPFSDRLAFVLLLTHPPKFASGWLLSISVLPNHLITEL